MKTFATTTIFERNQTAVEMTSRPCHPSEMNLSAPSSRVTMAALRATYPKQA